MSPGHVDHDTTAHRFPRVSGDEPGTPTEIERIDRFSPRERG